MLDRLRREFSRVAESLQISDPHWPMLTRVLRPGSGRALAGGGRPGGRTADRLDRRGFAVSAQPNGAVPGFQCPVHCQDTHAGSERRPPGRHPEATAVLPIPER
jgi:hypothetical protein